MTSKVTLNSKVVEIEVTRYKLCYLDDLRFVENFTLEGKRVDFRSMVDTVE